MIERDKTIDNFIETDIRMKLLWFLWCVTTLTKNLDAAAPCKISFVLQQLI